MLLRIAFDTSGPHVSAVLADGAAPLLRHEAEMPKGQAEALMPALEALLTGQGVGWADLQAIGVGIGPGNFTGTRIAVSAARGLSLALGIPAVGLSAFALRRDPGRPEAHANELVTLDAPRGQLYGQRFSYGEPEGEPLVFDPDAPPEALQSADLLVTGAAARTVAQRLGARANDAPLDDLPLRMARLLDWRMRRPEQSAGRPAPLYVRPADAAPPADAPPVVVP